MPEHPRPFDPPAAHQAVRVPSRQDVRALAKRQGAEMRRVARAGGNQHQVAHGQQDRMLAYSHAPEQVHG